MNSIGKLWDINPSFGGPIVRDKVWFFGTYRYQVSRQNVASMWVNRNAGNPNAWTYDPILTEQAVADGNWNNGSGRITWQVTPRNKFSAWTSVQYHCLYCDGGGDGTGLGFGAAISSPEATADERKPPEHADAIELDVPVHQSPAARGQRATRALLLVGQPSEEFLRHDDDSGAGDRRAPFRTSITVRRSVSARSWSGHTGMTNIFQGAVSYITGSHSAKVGFRYHHNMSTFPKNYYNNTLLKYTLHGRRSQSGDGVRRPRIGAGTAADHVCVLRAGSLDDQSSLGAGRAALRASGRLLPRAADGAEPLPAHRLVFPAEDGPLNQKDLMPRFGASYDVFGNGKTAAEVLHGPVRDDVQHR